ncbi:MAG TPA: tripartite tricarboxylate transporter TctB family protein [Advenella kashmirensis]|uniref:Tripartite tricarboxylate transporter TctB family protein n=1 Tax=Advenella kashmirensis TaxID=310575 RepID=A0A356LFR6_9BURK|nr:tripartite tricarboxylate transporter TctB family protein [Advenella kashmirensis]
MKISDTLSGIMIGIFAIIVFAMSLSFPPTPGQEYGSGLFPRLIAIGLLICSVCLIVQSRRRRDKQQWLAWHGLNTVTFLRFCMIPASLVFYFLTAQWLGFFISSGIILMLLFLVFGVKPVRGLILTVISVLTIHLCFYNILQVPLPWGLLEPFAW